MTIKGLRAGMPVELVENTSRQMNIASVNEMVGFCHHLRIDLKDLITAAWAKAFGFQPFMAGPGVSANCIPIAPNHLFRLVEPGRASSSATAERL